MYDISYGELILRLILSTVLGGIIGLEREVGNRPAGLRTHILVCIGATLVMLVSKYGFENNSDPARLAAQVVSGIGFLGAGTILRTGNTIQGLTTAASLWVCAGIGLAIGSGFYLGAIASTIIVLLSLVIFVHVENIEFIKKKRRFTIIARERTRLIGDIGTFFGNNNLIIKKFVLSPYEGEDDNLIEINLSVDIKSDEELNRIVGLLYNIDGIEKITLEK